jgi:hypothetical protein
MKSPCNLVHELIAHIRNLQLAHAFLEAMENITPDVTLKRQFAVYVHKEQPLPKWLRMVVDKF